MKLILICLSLILLNSCTNYELNTRLYIIEERLKLLENNRNQQKTTDIDTTHCSDR